MFLRSTAEAKLSEGKTFHKEQSGLLERTSHTEDRAQAAYSEDEESRTPMSLTCSGKPEPMAFLIAGKNIDERRPFE